MVSFINMLPKILKSAVLVFLGFILILLLAAIIPREWMPPEKNCPVIEFHVKTYGHHTAFILPHESVPATMIEKLQLEENTNFIEFAWGDHDYFMNPEFDLKQGMKALFTSTPSVLFVAGYTSIPDYLFRENRVKITSACEYSFSNLLEFIMDEFREDESGNYIFTRRGTRPNSAYYHANSTYHVFYNSNNWVSKGLRETNLNSPLWGGLAYGVMLHVDE